MLLFARGSDEELTPSSAADTQSHGLQTNLILYVDEVAGILNDMNVSIGNGVFRGATSRPGG
jgi:hypothetical protein